LNATQSSTSSSCGTNCAASKAIDGNNVTISTSSNYDPCTATNYESNPWWMVDLGRQRLVANVHILGRTDNPTLIINPNTLVYVGNDPIVTNNPYCTPFNVNGT
jgi:hypothetical protein